MMELRARLRDNEQKLMGKIRLQGNKNYMNHEKNRIRFPKREGRRSSEKKQGQSNTKREEKLEQREQKIHKRREKEKDCLNQKSERWRPSISRCISTGRERVSMKKRKERE
jgi:hypothetical protein